MFIYKLNTMYRGKYFGLIFDDLLSITGLSMIISLERQHFTSFPLCVKKTLAMFWAAGFSWSALGFGNLIPHPILSPTWDLGPNGLPKPFAL